MEQELRTYLLKIARTYALWSGYALATVSRRAHGTDRFFREYAKGKRTVTISKWQEIYDALIATWPSGAPYPEPPKLVLSRPSLSRKSPLSTPLRRKKRRARRESAIAAPMPEGDGRSDDRTRNPAREPPNVDCLPRQS